MQEKSKITCRRKKTQKLQLLIISNYEEIYLKLGSELYTQKTIASLLTKCRPFN